MSRQCHACSWKKYPSRSPILPLHPLATLLSSCMLPYYTLLTLIPSISPTFSVAVLHRFELSTCKILAAHSYRPWWSTAATAVFHHAPRLLPSHRNVDLYTADGYHRDLLYDGIDKTVHGAPQLFCLILDEPTLHGQDPTIQQPLQPASHTISASDLNTVKCCGDGDCGCHSLINGRNRHFGQVCIHICYTPFITTVTNSYLPVCANRLY